MTSITVEQVRATDSLYTLNMYYGDVYIGEYERSKHQNIERKKKEVDAAADWLLGVFREHGALQVRWDGKNKVKSVRVAGVEVARIPKKYWRG